MKNDMARERGDVSGVIPVVFAANDRFVPYFAACLQSVLRHTSSEHRYDLILFHTDVREESRSRLSDMAAPYPNVSLRFLDTGRFLRDYKLKANGHITGETYYRFLIQELLPEYDKVLYLDCDLIVNADVAALYQTDVEGYLLAAARDPEFLGHLNGADPKIQKYILSELRMRRPENYFQAGVILFNEKEMRKAHTLEQWLTLASRPFRYNDQDVLNLACEGRVRFLDMSWNLLTDCDHTRVSQVISYAPQEIREAYFAARKAPKIIHYAGYRKPWQKPTEDMAGYFWDAMRATPFYETALYNMATFSAEETYKSKSLLWRAGRKIKRFLQGRRKPNAV